MKLSRLVFGLLLVALLPGVAGAFLEFVRELPRSPGIAWWIAGTVLGIALEHFFLKRYPVFGTFEHEATHALVALAFFRPVHRFTVTLRRGGSVEHGPGFGGTIGDDFIGLAPYYLPTLTVIAALARPLAQGHWLPAFDLCLGITFGYHCRSALDEIRGAWTKRTFPAAGSGALNRTDIGSRGYAYSALFIVVTLLAVHGALFAFLLDRWPGLLAWTRAVGGHMRVWMALVALRA